MSLAQIADVVGGDLSSAQDGRRTVESVVIDSRAAVAGALFVALPGERADGHEFIGDAVSRGARGYLAAADHQAAGVPGAVLVDDPADALLGLGAWVRDTVDPTVIGVTGSSGKTTTKDLIAAACSAEQRTVATPGSYNNELGVPLTCCMLEPDSKVLVAEIGARGIGHIASLASILRPDVAVVTMVGAAHLEMLGDLDTVARAKRELVESLEPAGGTAVLNADDPRVAAMAADAPGRVLTYGVAEDADWRACEVAFDAAARPRFVARHPGGEVRVQLPMPGAHNVGNALAALAAASLCGVDPEAAAEGVSRATLSRWRMELRRRADGLVVLNDAYNANPSSMRAALETLARMEVAGRRWAVLGRMAELGPGGPAEHAAVGRRCAELGLDGLVVVGEDSIAEAARAAGFAGAGGVAVADSAADAVALLRERLEAQDAVLVKASRSVGLEGVAEALVGADESEGGSA